MGVVLSALLGLGNAQAQQGTTFLAFEGMGIVLDNPPPQPAKLRAFLSATAAYLCIASV
jgi:hypothetical protein